MSANNFPVEVRDRIRKIRQLREYSQEYMGEQLGITQKGYSAIETGEAPLTLERLEKIAEILEIEIPKLLSFDEKMLFYNYQHSNNTFYGNNSAGSALVKQLQEEVTFLKEQIKKLHEIIDKLGN